MKLMLKVTLFWLALSSMLFAADFRFVKIDVPNAAATQPAGINARGDIVGIYFDAGGVSHGFLLRQRVFSTIDFPHASSTSARAVNARGDVVGWFTDAGGNTHGFLLLNGHFKRIDYPGASATLGRGINNAGDITGDYFDSVGNEIGFILKDGEFHTVRVPDSCSTDVWTAMDNGRVLVGDFCGNADGLVHGFVRSRPGNFQTIDFPSALISAVRWINERGDIVGLYCNTPDECSSFSTLHGFLLRQGQYTAINFPGAPFDTLRAINDDGEMVGDFTDKQGMVHGFKAVPTSEQ
jgi:probable HAF family extracellular repeat protein